MTTTTYTASRIADAQRLLNAHRAHGDLKLREMPRKTGMSVGRCKRAIPVLRRHIARSIKQAYGYDPTTGRYTLPAGYTEVENILEFQMKHVVSRMVTMLATTLAASDQLSDPRLSDVADKLGDAGVALADARKALHGTVPRSGSRAQAAIRALSS